MDQILNLHCPELTYIVCKGVAITLFYKFTNGEAEGQTFSDCQSQLPVNWPQTPFHWTVLPRCVPHQTWAAVTGYNTQFYLNSFIKVDYTYCTIHSFEVHGAICFSIFMEMYNSHTVYFRAFPSPQKEIPYPLAVTPSNSLSPTVSNNKSIFCLYKFP